jgi:hypothetical protein
MDAYGTNIVQGEVIIKINRVHGGIFNCLVIPAQAPDEWFFKQFPDEQLIFDYALANNFSVRKEE